MRNDNKEEDVMCWNCFTADTWDDDVEPITLKKVRIQQREKLKVYPFLASELTKPKAVALKQKLSSHYQVGKKNSEKIHKIKDLHSDGKINELQVNEDLKKQDENTSDGKYVPPLESNQSYHTKNDNNIHLDDNDIDEKIKIQSIPSVVSDVTVKRNANDVNNDLINENKTSSVISTSVIEKEVNKNIKPTIIRVNQREATSINCGIKNYDKNLELTSSNTRNVADAASLVNGKESVGEITNISDKRLESSDETVKYTIDNDTKLIQQSISNNTSYLVDTASNETEKTGTKSTPPRSPISRIPIKIERLTPKSSKKIIKSRDSFEIPKTLENTSPSKDIKKIQIQNNTPKLGKIASDTTAKKRSESFLKYLGITKKKYQEPLKTQEKTPSTNIEDKIKNINFKMDTSETVNEVDVADGDRSEEIVAQSTDEVTDETSITNSESGYTGSTGTLKYLDSNNDNSDMTLQLRTKSVEVLKPHKDDDTTIRRDETVFTSLSSLSNIPKQSSLSKSSTITPIKKPVKSLRWSTLSIPARKFSFEDDFNISDASTPHHGATLPRRSNSPLPHERDFDRERFPVNRSGLQARSESMASVYSGAGEARGGVVVRGEVQFSLLFNYRLGALEVRVRGCRDLAPVDVKRNRSDPYVKVYLLPDKSKSGKRKTKVKKNTLSPVFEETLSFVQPLSSVASRTLWLSVWHADMFGRNDFLGEVRLPLADIVFDDPSPVWYKLHERTEQFDEQQGSRGDLIVGLKLELPDPRGKGTLRVLVKEAKNLVATKPNGLADVFSKSYLLPERGRLGKQKTGVCRRTLSPRWDHELVYRGVTSQQLAARALELSLWDRDRLASNDFMGAVRLSLGTGTYMGASVNWMDSVGKEVTLWQTMLDRPNFWVEGSLPLRPQLNN